MSFIDRKIQEIESRIELIKQANKTFKQAAKTLRPYIDFIQDELSSLTTDLESAKHNLNILREWYQIKETEHLLDAIARHLLTNLLRGLVDIEAEFYFQIDILIPLINDWVYQRNDQNLQIFHRILQKYVTELARLIKLRVPTLSTFRETYFCHSCFVAGRRVKGHVICAPYSEASALRRWAILPHEVGHAYFDLHAKQFERKVFPKVRSQIFALSTGTMREDIPRAAEIWLESWIPELVADCIATKSLGAAFVSTFISEALHWNPRHVDLKQPTHPPMDTRVRFQLEILKSLNLEGFSVEQLNSIWDSYTRNVIYESEPFIENLLLSPEVVETTFKEILDLITLNPVIDVWSSILETKDSLQTAKWKKTAILNLVGALALLPPTYDMSWIIKQLKEEEF